jgi:hypothetical protein
MATAFKISCIDHAADAAFAARAITTTCVGGALVGIKANGGGLTSTLSLDLVEGD